MKWLLDTTACIAAMKGHEGVIRRLQKCSPDDVAVSMISVFEVWSGVHLCQNPSKESHKVERFLSPLHVLPFDGRPAQVAAEIRADLQKKGTPIGPYDVLIAGHALAFGLTLVSANVSEFARIPALDLANWEADS